MIEGQGSGASREAQIVFVLKQAEGGTRVGEVGRKTGISEATFYAWRKKYAGLVPPEMRRLRQLDGENAKLRRLVADPRRQLVDAVRGYMAGQFWVGLWSAPGRAVKLPLSLMPRGSGPPEEVDEGDRRDASASRLSSRPCVAPAGGLGREREANIPPSQGERSAAAA